MPQLARELRLLLRLGEQRLEIDHRRIAALGKLALEVKHVSDAAGHAGREVSSRGSQNDDRAAGHVFAAMVTDALDDRAGAGIAHREALAGDATEVGFAGDRTIED